MRDKQDNSIFYCDRCGVVGAILAGCYSHLPPHWHSVVNHFTFLGFPAEQSVHLCPDCANSFHSIFKSYMNAYAKRSKDQ